MIAAALLALALVSADANAVDEPHSARANANTALYTNTVSADFAAAITAGDELVVDGFSGVVYTAPDGEEWYAGRVDPLVGVTYYITGP